MNEIKTLMRIQRLNGQILGALLWIPAYVFEEHLSPTQEEIEVSFIEGRIILGKEDATDAPTSAARAHPTGSTHD